MTFLPQVYSWLFPISVEMSIRTNYFSEMYGKLCEEYESSNGDRRLELEMRYGKQVIQRALEETRSNKWLETNSKQCPCCGTFIQVRLLTVFYSTAFSVLVIYW